jgi:UDP-N-acetylmuramyl pentapeptide synthase
MDVLLERLRPGDVVLVKASRGVELDLLVDALVARLGGMEAGPR